MEHAQRHLPMTAHFVPRIQCHRGLMGWLFAAVGDITNSVTKAGWPGQ